LIGVLGLSALGETLSRDGAVRLFTRANEEYLEAKKLSASRKPDEAHKRYGKAGALYRKLIDADFRDAQVFYNLGNTDYSLRRLGWAIVWFRRAEQLAPRNADLLANLAQVRTETEDKADLPGAAPVIRGMFFWHFAYSLDELTRTALTLYGLLMVACVAYIFTRSRWIARAAVILGALLLAVVGSLALRVGQLRAAHPGVIIARQAEIRYGPGEEYEVKFEIHEGAELVVEAESENWYKVLVHVEVKDGSSEEAEAPPEASDKAETRRGWLPKETVEKI